MKGIAFGYEECPEVTVALNNSFAENGIKCWFRHGSMLNNWSSGAPKLESFIDAIMRRFEDDGCVVRKPNYILFEVGEHPKLPLEGHKLLRLSSSIGQASQKSGIATYIKAVTAIAKQHFGRRVRTWNEAFGSEGHYSWNDVHESYRSFISKTFNAYIAT